MKCMGQLYLLAQISQSLESLVSSDWRLACLWRSMSRHPSWKLLGQSACFLGRCARMSWSSLHLWISLRLELCMKTFKFSLIVLKSAKWPNLRLKIALVAGIWSSLWPGFKMRWLTQLSSWCYALRTSHCWYDLIWLSFGRPKKLRLWFDSVDSGCSDVLRAPWLGLRLI